MSNERPEIDAFDHVAIEVRDLEAAIDFYSRVLGLAELSAPSAAVQRGIRWFALPEGKMLHLVHNPEASSARVGHLAFRVRDVEAWRQHFATEGIEDEPATVQLYGAIERIFVRDPSGNRLEFLKWAS